MVVFAVKTVLVVTGAPPVAAVNQPLKVWPSLLGVGKVASVPSVPVTPLVGLTVPLFGSNVIVKVGIAVTIMLKSCV
jgi:hypothetical protein